MSRRVREPGTTRLGEVSLLALPVVAALLAGLLAPLSPAAAPPTPQRRVQPPAPPPPPEGAARFSAEERAQIGARTLLLNGHTFVPAGSALGMALQQCATLKAGVVLNCWTILDTDQFRPFPEALLADIEDGKDIYVGSLEAGAYEKILVLANLTSLKAFAGAADRTLGYGHLFNHPAKYRGQVAHAEGRLRRIERIDPPANVLAEGVHDLYVAWIINDAYGANPYRAVFTNWPAGLPRSLLGQTLISQKIFVTFDGYFFKKHRYKAADSKEKTAREAPMLIGNSLVVVRTLAPTPPPAADGWVGQLLYVFMGLLGGVVLVVAALTYWFRRSDSGTRRRLLATRNGELVLPPPDALPVAPPADQQGHRASLLGQGTNQSRSVSAETSAATRWGDRTGERGTAPSSGDGKSGGDAGSKGGTGLAPDPGEDAGA